MARIAGVDLPRDKRVEIGLTSIYGIGRTSATKIVDKAGVNPDTRCRDLTDEEVKKLSEVISEDYMVEGDLRREVAMNIKRLSEIGCYRGIRHRKGLPVRGQKTKTNARTRKGPKKTIANKIVLWQNSNPPEGSRLDVSRKTLNADRRTSSPLLTIRSLP